MAIKQIIVPNIGEFADVAVIDVYISVGDTVEAEDSVIALESEKAVTDIPTPYSGTITKVHIKEGDLVSKDSLIAEIEVDAAKESKEEPKKEKEVAAEKVEEPPKKADKVAAETEKIESKPVEPAQKPAEPDLINEQASGATYHATPALRKYARELGVDLAQVTGSGPHGRILHEDVQKLVKQALSSGGRATPGAIKLEDFSVYGEIERKALSRIQKISGPHLQASWQTIPHVTQFDEADVTELEEFRKELKAEMAKGKLEPKVNISILPFVIRAVTTALKSFPECNASFDEATNELILKHYYHIGIAVDTPEGLIVPVLKDADKKSITEIAVELSELSQRARERKLRPEDLSGGSFSISSLGGIGGTNFTPIINPPQTAILGVARMKKQPVWNGEVFIPRDILPFSLSYDHRVIDGAAGVRFTTLLVTLLHDIRRVLL